MNRYKTRYYIIPTLDDEYVAMSRREAVSFILEHHSDVISDLLDEDVEDFLHDVIDEIDYFEDLDVAQQNFVLER